MEKAAVRRWLAGFEAAAARDSVEARRAGPQAGRSLRISGSMIDAVLRDRSRRESLSRFRSGDEAATREAWRKLRSAAHR